MPRPEFHLADKTNLLLWPPTVCPLSGIFPLFRPLFLVPPLGWMEQEQNERGLFLGTF